MRSVLALCLLVSMAIAASTSDRQPHKSLLNLKPPATTTTTTEKPVESAEDDEVDFEGNWECGTEGFSKLISQQMIAKDCPTLLYAVNDCCIQHDKCYDDQKGQHVCDEFFCNCLDKTTDSADNSTFVCHDEHSPWFCTMVKTFGDGFYAGSVNQTTADATDLLFGESADSDELEKTSGNGTKSEDKHRIYESKNHKADVAIEGLHELETFN